MCLILKNILHVLVFNCESSICFQYDEDVCLSCISFEQLSSIY